MKKGLNLLLLASFVLTLLVPLTGTHIHKLAATLFLPLCLVHTGIYRRRLNGRRAALLGIIVLSFVSGLLGLVFEEIPAILLCHRVISTACVLFLAVHVAAFQARLRGQPA